MARFAAESIGVRNVRRITRTILSNISSSVIERYSRIREQKQSRILQIGQRGLLLDNHKMRLSRFRLSPVRKYR